jgi:hypothetical protein
MDLFFKRDCAEGGGPAVEFPRPFLVASPGAAVEAPAAGPDPVVFAAGGRVVLPVLNIVDAGAVVVGAEPPEVLPPPRPLNSDEPPGAELAGGTPPPGPENSELPVPPVVVGVEELAPVDVALPPPRFG